MTKNQTTSSCCFFCPFPWNQALALALLSLQCFLIAGLVFGWSSLKILLRKDGVYKCSDGDSSCSSQLIKFSLDYTVAQVSFGLSGLVAGLMIDDPRIGVNLTSIFGCCFIAIGFLFLANLGDDYKGNDFIIPALVCIGIGGSLSLFPVLRSADEFKPHHEKVITLFNTLFDSSAAMFAVFLLIYEDGVSRQAVFLGFAIFVFIMSTSHTVVARLLSIKEADGGEHDEDNDKKNDDAKAGDDHQKYGSFDEMIKSRNFICLLIYTGVNLLHTTSYLGSVGDALSFYADDDQVTDMVKVLSFMLCLCILAIPIGFWVVAQGPWTALTITNVLACIHSASAVFLAIDGQYFTFAVFVIYRMCLFSSIGAFVASVFGFKHFGTILGMTYTGGYVVALLQFPLSWWIETYIHGDWDWGYAIIGLCQLPLFLMDPQVAKYLLGIEYDDRVTKSEAESAIETSPLLE